MNGCALFVRRACRHRMSVGSSPARVWKLRHMEADLLQLYSTNELCVFSRKGHECATHLSLSPK